MDDDYVDDWSFLDEPPGEDDEGESLRESLVRFIEEYRADPARRWMVEGLERELELLDEADAREALEGDADRRTRELVRLAELSRLLPEIERDLVREARGARLSWSLIALLIGRSRQAVHQRFAEDPTMPVPGLLDDA